MKSERNKVDVASVVQFLAEATVVSALWDYFAASHGMLKYNDVREWQKQNH
jgi:hypothetical protein